jgi:uncharacterized protein (TIGR01244 family)
MAALTRGLLLHQMHERLTLAGQPQPEDWPHLAAAGFQVVINMRSDHKRAAHEQANATAAGLEYLHLPLPAYELEPEHLALFHAKLNSYGGNILLHCRSATRVALLWMLDQIVYGRRNQAEVEAELRAAGYDNDSLATFSFCTEDYFERAGAPA